MEIFIFPTLFQGGKVSSWKKQFLGPLDNSKGQTLITWLVLLSFILTLTLAAGSAHVLIQNRMEVMTTCRLGNLKTQSEVEPLLKRLISLNPQARLLRLLMLAAKARLAAAIAHYNIPMAIHARYDISQIRRKQQLLDQTQKALVKAANIKLHSGTISTYLNLQKAFQEIRNRGSKWSSIDFKMQNPKIPKLAVKPEDYNLAPPYLARENFEKLQSSGHMWTQTYSANSFFKFKHLSISQCHATLEEDSWIPKIRRDKLLSR